MLVWLAAAVSVYRPIDFSAEPPARAVATGQQLFLAKEKLDRTLQGSREVLGRWFDGRVHKETDLAIWLSPDALAGWYGYLAARDAWAKDQTQKRWTEAREALQGDLVFVVRVAAMAKADPLDFGTGKDADPTVLNNLQFRLSYKLVQCEHYGKPLAAQDGEFVLQTDGTYAAASPGVQEASIEKREPADILEQPFYHLSSLSKLFLAETETDEADDGVPLGDYYGAVYLVRFKRPASLSLCKSMKLDVMRKGKVSTVNFSLLEPIPEPKKKDPWAPRRTISAGGFSQEQ